MLARVELVVVIRSFRDDDTAGVFERRHSRRLPVDVQRRAYRRLMLIDAATRLEELFAQRGNRLKSLRGDRRGQHSIRVNDQWRICFRWHDGDAFDVEICDYH
jgi:proteic killer suppression protein